MTLPPPNPQSHAAPLDPSDQQLIELILSCYARGIFPMGTSRPGPLGLAGALLEDGPVDWVSVDPRSILPLDGLIISRSLRAKIRKRTFTITLDRAFEQVIQQCATVTRSRNQLLGEDPHEPAAVADHDDESEPAADDNPTWINPWIIDAFTKLHRAGYAHSVEAWLTPDISADNPAPKPMLVGGLYGLHLGSAFFGESMFSRPDLGGTDASKVCLVHLVDHLRSRGFTLLDTQYANPHMQRLGVIEIPVAKYLKLLKNALSTSATW
ncbi:MAG: leucyl/phenylalanyl-tRNA--protein transferase [Phycisphaerales bacterium]|nr:leucyl/phenylalanyl-tRNA--protein transferase [Phycisphaerales bacterium]